MDIGQLSVHVSGVRFFPCVLRSLQKPRLGEAAARAASTPPHNTSQRSTRAVHCRETSTGWPPAHDTAPRHDRSPRYPTDCRVARCRRTSRQTGAVCTGLAGRRPLGTGGRVDPADAGRAARFRQRVLGVVRVQGRAVEEDDHPRRLQRPHLHDRAARLSGSRHRVRNREGRPSGFGLRRGRRPHHRRASEPRNRHRGVRAEHRQRRAGPEPPQRRRNPRED